AASWSGNWSWTTLVAGGRLLARGSAICALVRLTVPSPLPSVWSFSGWPSGYFGGSSLDGAAACTRIDWVVVKPTPLIVVSGTRSNSVDRPAAESRTSPARLRSCIVISGVVCDGGPWEVR